MRRRCREDLSEMPDWLKKKKCPNRDKYLSGKRILPKNLTGREKLADVVDEAFLAYNGARLKEGCQLFVRKMLEPEVTVGMSLSGALTPAGLGCSAIVPLIKAGFVDWIVSTGANLYHDLHFALNYPVRAGSFKMDDVELRDNDIVRIYDVLIGYSDCLMATDEILRSILVRPEFQKEMGTGEFHHLLGRYAAEWERKAGLKDASVLAAAYRAGVPCYTSSPGDSTIGMNVAGVELRGNRLRINPSIDVNETTAFVLAAKRAGGKSAVVLWGGGSPKNFMLQTEPQIQEVLRIKEFGQDYFLQVTDARPDTGGLSGATPSEAVSWGKVDPDRLPDAVVCYTDTTIALPILTHYALARHKPRKLKRLYDRRATVMKALTKEYFLHNKVKMVDGTEPRL
jgi:deoxyhypusine synthase